MNLESHVTCDFNCFIETAYMTILKVTGSHMHCKFGNISETVHDRDVASLNH